MLKIRLTQIQATQDGSGNISVTLEVLENGKLLPGYVVNVSLTTFHLQAIAEKTGLQARFAKLLEIGAAQDARLEMPSLKAFVAANAASAQRAAQLLDTFRLPIEVNVT